MIGGDGEPGTYPSPPTQPHNSKRRQPSRSVSPRIATPEIHLVNCMFAEILIRPCLFRRVPLSAFDLPARALKQASHNTGGDLIGPFSPPKSPTFEV